MPSAKKKPAGDRGAAAPTSETGEGAAHVPGGTGRDLTMPDDQADGADDRHADRDRQAHPAKPGRTDS
jgi:hypothetical protein